MSRLKRVLDSLRPTFESGGKLEKLFPVYEALDTILFASDRQTASGPHVRDNIDLKRVMILVVIALIPATVFGMINIGYQEALAAGMTRSWGANLAVGARVFLPMLLVTYAVGGFWEFLFAVVRRHEVDEGFLVTGLLIPLIMPPTLPLWQLVVATTFGTVIGKMIFGGTGMNIFNPALVTRAFVFFAYPGHISGDQVWVLSPDGFSGATALAVPAAVKGGQAVTLLHSVTQFDYSWWNLFLGWIPGSIGETSKLMILIGAVILLYTGVASWRVMLGAVLGLVFASSVANFFSPYSTNTMLTIPPHYHLVMGGFLFGAVFMATDPVSSSYTDKGRWIYGFMIGLLTVTIRAVNPAYPEGAMLSILLMNAFSPLIDYYVVKGHIKRRQARYAK
ncbi:MAG: NADH:ubiquinone reductase (Na(+)-transporting) subunit B [Candidatus Neomarinimicrobiota bacterium]|nr:MAG: NADH:ubiquinone reductase (Na(+)-transporting) subunit B [Candidatus Neomarinimicrobiota bacterium]